MSKLMNELSHLNERRKPKTDVVIDDAAENQESGAVVREHKGIYVLSFLVTVLIALSAVSMSAGLKTFSQLESLARNAKAIQEKLNQQGNNIQALQALIMKNTSEELARINELQDQMKRLNVAVSSREQELSDMTAAYNGLRQSIQSSVDELKASDRLMLKKFIQLNDKVEQIEKTSYLNLDSY